MWSVKLIESDLINFSLWLQVTSAIFTDGLCNRADNNAPKLPHNIPHLIETLSSCFPLLRFEVIRYNNISVAYLVGADASNIRDNHIWNQCEVYSAPAIIVVHGQHV